MSLAHSATTTYFPIMDRRRIDVLAAVGVLLLSVTGLLDVLVLLPGVLAPSTGLPQVWAEVVSKGDLVPVLAGPTVWALLCAMAVVRHLRARRPRAALVVGGTALVEFGVLAALAQMAASGMGLWLSNHLRPFEGGTTAFEDVALVLGGASITGGVVLLMIGRAHCRARRTAAV
ncbi:hypothetical protein [Amnibacterium kyonggiense]|uniref:hypothetical protein n=1 Tax=Amnibacterium kyonggiense TaxID=595671 RepID=UPI00105B38D6|nr:hypothetical protein [Amnibacterium kyonggiense]